MSNGRQLGATDASVLLSPLIGQSEVLLDASLDSTAIPDIAVFLSDAFDLARGKVAGFTAFFQ